MSRDLILGTAGHIDHGKTALVKALTGVDTDRLPEEQARGITIDIGFAALDLGEFRLGVVDVPGHERFVRNMLAGATGIDLALLVVAADDSVMPQTREHLEILKLLGILGGVIALTKCDVVDETTRDLVALEVAELVKGSFLDGAPIVPTSAMTGAGIEELKAALQEACQGVVEQMADGWFRLAIDRSFVVQGAGTVVTGSVTSGRLHVGDEVEWLPHAQRVRVRALHRHNRPVEEVHRGQRAAVNLAGVDHAEVQRGQEIATPGWLKPTRTLTVQLAASPDAHRPLRHRTPIRLHIGTAEVLGLLSLLDCDALEPGGRGLGQLFLAEPVMAVWGQPFVLRESSAATTLGGGLVLQPTARKIRRRHLEVLERLEMLLPGVRDHGSGVSEAEKRASAVAWFAGVRGVTVTDLVRDAGIAPDQADLLLNGLRQSGEIIEIGRSLLHADVLRDLDERLLASLNDLHQQHPLMTAHDRSSLVAQFNYVGDESLIQAVVDRLLRTKKLVGDGRRVARADFTPKLSVNQRKLKDKIVAAHHAALFQPPEPSDFANFAGGNAAGLKDIYDVCIAEGHLVKVTEAIFLHTDAEADMRRRVTAKLADGPLTVADIRDLLGTTRKFAVPLCEYLDRVGITRREGDQRFQKEL